MPQGDGLSPSLSTLIKLVSCAGIEPTPHGPKPRMIPFHQQEKAILLRFEYILYNKGSSITSLNFYCLGADAAALGATAGLASFLAGALAAGADAAGFAAGTSAAWAAEKAKAANTARIRCFIGYQ